ncbi:hypothetical protein C8J57DRAFT_1726286 [Mycena rebaudengoi]|nr:hypothetical protein C8J57DRAFT_1726286 [Mycena rebaudengoi]
MAANSVGAVATIQSPVFGVNKGTHFNDLQEVKGINMLKPIKNIQFACGDALDGFTINYNVVSQTATVPATHGTKPASKDTKWLSLEDKETIVAISGRRGATVWGDRIIALSFTTFNDSTGEMKVYGPYGGSGADKTGGTAFRVSANGILVAFGGYAINTEKSLNDLKTDKVDGGLYGLTFSQAHSAGASVVVSRAVRCPLSSPTFTYPHKRAPDPGERAPYLRGTARAIPHREVLTASGDPSFCIMAPLRPHHAARREEDPVLEMMDNSTSYAGCKKHEAKRGAGQIKQSEAGIWRAQALS